MNETLIAKTVDASGLACPLPVVKTRKAIDSLQAGEVLEVISTDKGSRNDLTAWVKAGGHQLLESREENGLFHYHIRKG